jgi:hypothetical protein
MRVWRSHSRKLLSHVREIRNRCIRVETLPCEALLDLRERTHFDPGSSLVHEACTTILGEGNVPQPLTNEAVIAMCESRELFDRLLREGIDFLTRKIIVVLMMNEDMRHFIARHYDEDDDETGAASDSIDLICEEAMCLLHNLVRRRNDILRSRGDAESAVVPDEFLNGDRRLMVLLMNRLRNSGTV